MTHDVACSLEIMGVGQLKIPNYLLSGLQSHIIRIRFFLSRWLYPYRSNSHSIGSAVNKDLFTLRFQIAEYLGVYPLCTIIRYSALSALDLARQKASEL